MIELELIGTQFLQSEQVDKRTFFHSNTFPLLLLFSRLLMRFGSVSPRSVLHHHVGLWLQTHQRAQHILKKKIQFKPIVRFVFTSIAALCLERELICPSTVE
jgi:hypothetical protein